MRLFSKVFGKKAKASAQPPTSKIASMSCEVIDDTLYPEVQGSGLTRKPSIASSSSSNVSLLFGEDGADFLDDVVRRPSAPPTFQQPVVTPAGHVKSQVVPVGGQATTGEQELQQWDITEVTTDVGGGKGFESDSDSDFGTPTVSKTISPQEVTVSADDEQTDCSTDKESDISDEDAEITITLGQIVLVEEYIPVEAAVTEEQPAENPAGTKSTIYISKSGSSWTDSDDDDDFQLDTGSANVGNIEESAQELQHESQEQLEEQLEEQFEEEFDDEQEVSEAQERELLVEDVTSVVGQPKPSARPAYLYTSPFGTAWDDDEDDWSPTGRIPTAAEQPEVNTKPSYLYKPPFGGTSWDDDEDDWTPPGRIAAYKVQSAPVNGDVPSEFENVDSSSYEGEGEYEEELDEVTAEEHAANTGVEQRDTNAKPNVLHKSPSGVQCDDEDTESCGPAVEDDVDNYSSSFEEDVGNDVDNYSSSFEEDVEDDGPTFEGGEYAEAAREDQEAVAPQEYAATVTEKPKAIAGRFSWADEEWEDPTSQYVGYNDESRNGYGNAKSEVSDDAPESNGGEQSFEENQDDQGSTTDPLDDDDSFLDNTHAGDYVGTSRSLDVHPWQIKMWRLRLAQEEADNDYYAQKEELEKQFQVDILNLEEPSTIEPDGEDRHDELCRLFVDEHPALPSDADHGHMHLFDWRRLRRPNWDVEGEYILKYVKPRLCDAVATALFGSDPDILDSFLDMNNKVVEWWHNPHYGAFCTMIRRVGNDVTVGTYADHGFKLCWSRYVKAKIDSDGRWNECYSRKGVAFSNKVNGEVDWDLIPQTYDPMFDDKDELWDPVGALWNGRLLGRVICDWIFESWLQYRSGNTVKWAVDGKLRLVEERGVRRMPRKNGIENDRTAPEVAVTGLLPEAFFKSTKNAMAKVKDGVPENGPCEDDVLEDGDDETARERDSAWPRSFGCGV